MSDVISKAIELLQVASCPCCDGSGAYYDNHGGVCQCQFCYEREQEIEALQALQSGEPVVPDAEALARMFHEGYERLASVAGYETRMETRSFNLESPNGKLMVLVCAEIRKALLSAGAVAAPQPVVDELCKALSDIAEWTDRYTAPNHPISVIAKKALLSAGKGGE